MMILVQGLYHEGAAQEPLSLCIDPMDPDHPRLLIASMSSLDKNGFLR